MKTKTKLNNIGVEERKVYKVGQSYNVSDCKIVSMSPGDLAVAGCFCFSGRNF